MSTLKLHNSLTGRKEDFVPIDPAHVRVYACGPTVYSYAHIGNARMAVVFDLLVRVLRTLYPKVTYVSNITDVDDKIMDAAKESGEEISAITEKFTQIYNEDMAGLNNNRPDVQPTATTHIPEMIALIAALIARGHAYEAKGHVLFNVPSFPAYGGLSGRSRDDQIAGARVEVSPFEKDPADFVLWKPSTPDQPGWDSPWGRGRPGWHIECSAMAEKHLGLPFDIHGGGADLKFPHHENEIAQSCCAHGQENDLAAFAKYWVHNGFLTVEGEKMSKSSGNFILTHELYKHYTDKRVSGEVIRFALLAGHYSQPLNWTQTGFESAKRTLDGFYKVLKDLEDIDDQAVDIPESFMGVIYDDLNTPKAYAQLSALSKKAAELRTPEAKAEFKLAGQLLGSFKVPALEWKTGVNIHVDITLSLGLSDSLSVTRLTNAEIDNLLTERDASRKSKNFSRSDEIRKQLEEQGIVIEDTPAGPKWRKA